MSQYTPLLQKLPIPALFVGLDGIARIVSDQAKELGYEEGNLVTQPWLERFLESRLEKADSLIECQSKWWQIRMQLVDDGVVVVATDVSSQINAQKAMIQAHEDQASYSRQVLRHDAATYLNNIDNYLSILLEEPSSIHFISKAQTSSTKLRALLESFAYLYGAGKTKPRLLVFRELIEYTLQELHLIIEEKKALVSIEGNGTTVWGDATRLEEAIGNLIRNALHYQPPEENHIPKVDIRIFPDEKDSRFVILEIEDNGIGISPEHCESIFYARTRLHSTQDYSGSGLGLAIVKQIVLEHDGQLGVASEPGNGSTFWVRLPRSSEYLARRG